jgi:hypothetical protein
MYLSYIKSKSVFGLDKSLRKNEERMILPVKILTDCVNDVENFDIQIIFAGVDKPIQTKVGLFHLNGHDGRDGGGRYMLHGRDAAGDGVNARVVFFIPKRQVKSPQVRRFGLFGEG